MVLKKLLTSLAVACVTICVNAQDHVQVVSDFCGVIPGEVLSEDGKLLWNASDGGWHGTYGIVTIMDSRLSVLKTFSVDNAKYGIFPVAYNDSYREDYIVPVTQDFFDDDDQFEYVVPSCVEGEYDDEITAISIKKEDGTILRTIAFGDGYYVVPYDYKNQKSPISIVHLGGEEVEFLRVCLEKESEDNKHVCVVRYYSFERGNIATSLKKVADIPTKMKVSPTLPQKNETIKVDLSGMSSPKKLTVVDMNGKVCFTQSVQSDQKSVELSTSGMPAGMYIIRVSDGKKEVDNCRVIIR